MKNLIIYLICISAPFMLLFFSEEKNEIEDTVNLTMTINHVCEYDIIKAKNGKTDYGIMLHKSDCTNCINTNKTRGKI